MERRPAVKKINTVKTNRKRFQEWTVEPTSGEMK